MSEGKTCITVGNLVAFCLVLVFDPSLNVFKSLQTRLIEQLPTIRKNFGYIDLKDITQENWKNINFSFPKGRFSQVYWRDILFYVVWIVSNILWAYEDFITSFNLETEEEAT